MDEILKIYPNDNWSINIDNLSDTNANDFAEFDIVLEKEGKQLNKETVTLDIEPGHNYWYFLELPDDAKNGEYVYTLTGKAKKAVGDVKKGAVINHAQKIVTVTDRPEEVEVKNYPELNVSEDAGDITISGQDFEMVFSKGLGGLTEMRYQGVDYLNAKPQVTFWRPLTDTDLTLGLNFENALWLAATVGQKLIPEKYYFEKVDNSYRLIFVYQYPLPGGQESAVIYTVHPDGTLGVETTYSGLATLNYMPTFGMNFKLNKDLDAIRYYGYGPEENYIDTTEGLDLGVYETTVKKNFKKNARPQETGNRTGVRWAEVYNAKTGKGLRFTADTDVFEFAALPYHDLEIEAAQTVEELPKSASTNVRIAGKVSGVGNGEYLDEWAKVDAGEMIELKFNIKPVEVEVKKAKKAPAPKAKKETPVSTKEEKPVEEKKEAPKAEVKAAPKKEVEKAPAKKEETKAAPKKEEAKVEPKKAEVKAEPKKEEAKPATKTEEPKKVTAKKAESKPVKETAKVQVTAEKETKKAAPAKKASTRKTTLKK